MISAEFKTANVHIQSLSESKSATGGIVRGWTSKSNDIKAGVNGSIELQEIYGRMGIKAGLRFYFDADYSITVNDRIVYDGNHYEVRAINNVGGANQIWQIDTERIDN